MMVLFLKSLALTPSASRKSAARFRRGTALVVMLACLVAGPVYAGCTGPTGSERDIIYNTDYHAAQFCNGANWLPLGTGTGGGGGGCTGPTNSERAIMYNGDFHTYQFCNGTNWVKFGGGLWQGAAPGAGNGYFVMSYGTWNGNLGGSLAAADAKCLTDLTTHTGWKGYATANANGQLIAAKVKAFICADGGNCNTLTANKTYYFANAADSALGGNRFTTDSAGSGPGDTADWGGPSYFGTDASYWSDRYTTDTGDNNRWSAGMWSSSAACNTTNYWDTGTNAANGALGSPSTNATLNSVYRWYGGPTVVTCDTQEHLICFVNP